MTADHAMTLRLPDDLARDLRVEAAHHGLSMAEAARWAIRGWTAASMRTRAAEGATGVDPAGAALHTLEAIVPPGQTPATVELAKLTEGGAT